MLIFNSLGLLGVVASVGLAMLFGVYIGPLLHLPEGRNFVFSLQGMTFLMALFALTFDRCEEPTLLQGYKLNISNFFMGFSHHMDNGKGIFYRPDRQLCYCGIPLVTAPFFVLIGVLVFWVYDLTDTVQKAKSSDYPLFTLTGLITITLGFGYARLTGNMRNLPDSVIVLREEPTN